MNNPFTEKYIAMVKAAKEIQDMRSNPNRCDGGLWGYGDWSVIDGYGESEDGIATPMLQCFGGTEFDGMDFDFPTDCRTLIFIPRLDQLIDMLDNSEPIYFRKGEDYPAQVLKMVMLSKFDKAWNGKEWVAL